MFNRKRIKELERLLAEKEVKILQYEYELDEIRIHTDNVCLMIDELIKRHHKLEEENDKLKIELERHGNTTFNPAH